MRDNAGRFPHLCLCYGLIACSVSLLLACTGQSRGPSPHKDAAQLENKPNVILILADDLGWRDLSSYGSSFYQTPRLDAFAASGVKFTHAYAAASTCSPTRASILTGQYPLRIGFTQPIGHLEGELKHQLQHAAQAYLHAAGPSSTNYLDEHYYTLGEAMKDAGYSTAFLGKWHLGPAPHNPEVNGFDFVVGGRHNSGPPGLNPQRAYYPPWDGDTFPASTRTLNMHVDDYLALRATEFIAAHRDKPFFMCFWPYDVHSPFQSKPDLIEKWKKRADPANPQHDPVMAAMVEVLDTSVGRVLDAVKENGLDQRTIIIFTSDNGGDMYEQVNETTATNNAPLRGGKGNNYDGGVRVPLIVRWPGVTQAGTVSNAAVTSTDHYPTILEMTGQQPRPQNHKDGVSYVAALRGEAFERPFIVSGDTQATFQTGNVSNTSIRENNWKLIRYWYGKDAYTHRYALYDTEADIGETHNMAAEDPAILESLNDQLETYYNVNNDILQPMPNQLYNGRSVGLWTSEGPGTAASENGMLEFESKGPGFAVATYFAPWVLQSSVFEFEARAQGRGSHGLRVDSLSGNPQMPVPEVTTGQNLAITTQWQRYRVTLHHDGNLRGLRIVPAGTGYQIEMRAARVLSPDNTEMMKYEFN